MAVQRVGKNNQAYLQRKRKGSWIHLSKDPSMVNSMWPLEGGTIIHCMGSILWPHNRDIMSYNTPEL